MQHGGEKDGESKRKETRKSVKGTRTEVEMNIREKGVETRGKMIGELLSCNTA